MKSLLKLIAVLCVIAVVSVFVIIKSLSQSFQEQTSLAAVSNISQQVSSVNQSVRLLSMQLKSSLLYSLTQEAQLHVGARSSFSPSALSKSFLNSDFQLMSLLQLSNNSQWEAAWTSVNKKSRKNPWTPKYVNKILQGLPLAIVNSKSLTFANVEAPNGENMIAVMLQKGVNTKDSILSGIVLALLPQQYFLSFNNSYKGTEDEFYLLSDKTVALVHPSYKYLGAKVDSHPAVKHLLASKKMADNFTFKSTEGLTRVTAFEKVGETNLYVMLSRTIKPWWFNFKGQMSFILLVVLACLVLMSIFIVRFFKPTVDIVDYLKTAIFSLLDDAPLAVPPGELVRDAKLLSALKQLQDRLIDIEGEHKSIPETTPTPVDYSVIEKQSLVENLIAVFVTKLTAPITAMSGYLQVAKAKPDTQALDKSISSIEGEVRTIKNFFEDLNSIIVNKDTVTSVVNLEESVLDILRDRSVALEQSGIRLKKKLGEDHYVYINHSFFAKTIENILLFLTESFSEQIQKNIFIYTSEFEGMVSLVFETNIEGLNKELIDKYLNLYSLDSEFKKAFPIAVAGGLMRSMGGDIKVFEKEGHSFVIYLNFRRSTEKAFENQNKLNLEEMTHLDSMLEEPSHDEVVDVVEPLPVVSDYEVVLSHNHQEGSLVNSDSFSGFDFKTTIDEKEERPLDELDDKEVQDFVMVKPPEMQVDQKAQIFTSESVAHLGGLKPISGDLNLPPVEKELKNSRVSDSELTQKANQAEAPYPEYAKEIIHKIPTQKEIEEGRDFKIDIRKPKVRV